MKAGNIPGRLEDAAACAMVVVFLLATLIVGGSSQEAGTGVFTARLLSLPLLAWGSLRLLRCTERPSALHVLLMLLAGALVLVPVLQLLLPATSGTGRAMLAHDMVQFGLPPPVSWSLTPAATRDGLFALLPAFAVFAMTASLSHAKLQIVALSIVALALASLLLGMAQLGAPQESALNPYPQWRPAMNGFFANPNHQATLLVVAGTLAAAHLVTALSVWPAGAPFRISGAVGAALVMILALAALPLTGSRAGVILFILSCAVVIACFWPQLRKTRRGGLVLLSSLAAAVFAVFAALRWMRVDAIDELRAPLRAVTGEIAARFSPWGSGVGSYVPVFEQEAPPRMLMSNYVNHAHNEYAQWWLEGGIPAIAVLLLAAAVLVASLLTLWRQPALIRAPAVAAWTALLAILAHSLVDYPLRTPAMTAVAAALLALVFGVATSERANARPFRRHNTRLRGHAGATNGRKVEPRASAAETP